MSYKRQEKRRLLHISGLFLIISLGMNVYLSKDIIKTVFRDIVGHSERSDTQKTINSLEWTDAKSLTLLGRISNTDSYYGRLSATAKDQVRTEVWEIAKYSAGLVVSFETNSSVVAVRYNLEKDSVHPNMTAILSKGVDLYCLENGKWQFVDSLVPKAGSFQESILVENMDNKSRKFLLNLPPYGKVKDLFIGVSRHSAVSKPGTPVIEMDRPIVFYGTSITQGSSASRPGLTYVNRILRRFNINVLNFGFSGNGRFEKEVVKQFIQEMPRVVILDCTHNSAPSIIENNLPETVDYIRTISEDIPIVLVDTSVDDNAFFDPTLGSIFRAKNDAVARVFDRVSSKYRNVYHLGLDSVTGSDHEATTDGTHFNDIGNDRAYETFSKFLEKIL